MIKLVYWFYIQKQKKFKQFLNENLAGKGAGPRCERNGPAQGNFPRGRERKRKKTKRKEGGPGRARPAWPRWPAWAMHASDGDPMAQGHRLLHATQGTSGRPRSAGKKAAAARGLTGDG
jgi:hypothetical protein